MRVNITLPGLIFLAHTKNEINRKRRRFYHLKNFGYNNATRLARGEKGMGVCHISKEEAEQGYSKAKIENKLLTRDFSSIRRLIGAKTHWGFSGNIISIKHQGKTYYSKDFKKISEDYKAEAILLGFCK